MKAAAERRTRDPSKGCSSLSAPDMAIVQECGLHVSRSLPFPEKLEYNFLWKIFSFLSTVNLI